jgi:3-oxoadipate CoA-transferase, beta subunit
MKKTYPLTAAGCVKRVYTELAVIDMTERGFVVTDMVPGLTIEELQERTGAVAAELTCNRFYNI